jgi:hypothetical protein
MFHYRRFILSLNLILLSIVVCLFSRKNIFKLKSSDYCLQNKIKINEYFYSNLVYIPDLKILFCDVPKAASTNLRRFIYVYFNKSTSYENLDRKNLWIDYNEFFRQFYLTDQSKLIYQNESLFKFLLVRHPFRRIYSAYNDKFVSDDSENIISGWKQFEEKILLVMKKNETLLTIRRKDLRLDFRTFLLYIIDTIRKKQRLNNHWEQIVQRCSVCLINYDWIGKIENFHEDQKILVEKFQGNSKEFPSKYFDQNDKKQISLNDFQLIELFRNTIQNDQDFQVLIDYYKPDFQLFDYTMPYL